MGWLLPDRPRHERSREEEDARRRQLLAQEQRVLAVDRVLEVIVRELDEDRRAP